MNGRVVDGGQCGAYAVAHCVGGQCHPHIVYHLGKVVTLQVVRVDEALQAGYKLPVVLLPGVTPLHLAQCSQSRQFHILHLLECFDILRPQVGLCTDDVPLLVGGETVWHGFVAVHMLQGQIATDGLGLVRLVGTLVVVEVQIGVGRHDNLVLQACRLNAAALAAPRHDGGVGGESALERLVPPNHLAAKLVEVLLGMAYEKTLQAFLGRVAAVGLQVFRCNARLTLRAALPHGFRTLVAAYVYILRREECHHLVKHIVDEMERFVIAHTQHTVRHAPLLPHLVGPSGAAQFGVGGQGGLHVAGHVNLGYDGDVAFGSVAHNVLDVLLCVIPAIGCAVILAAVVSDDGLGASCANLGQERILLYFDAPPLVVGQMPMETVDVVQRQYVDKTSHRVGRHKVARHVEVGPAVAEAWPVVYLGGWYQHLLRHTGGQGFAQRLHAVKATGG